LADDGCTLASVISLLDNTTLQAHNIIKIFNNTISYLIGQTPPEYGNRLRHEYDSYQGTPSGPQSARCEHLQALDLELRASTKGDAKSCVFYIMI